MNHGTINIEFTKEALINPRGANSHQFTRLEWRLDYDIDTEKKHMTLVITTTMGKQIKYYWNEIERFNATIWES